ncbi:Gfo/Idh/MocA family oxidoreductase [soil metagenome]
MDKTLQVGLTAFGMSGIVFHAPLIHAHPHFHLHSVLERNSKKSRDKYPDVKVVNNFGSLINDPELDVIVVNTPQHLHFNMCTAALEAGKHVVVEKPFTVTSNEAGELIKVGKKANKILTVFQNRRWDGDFLTVQKVVKSELLGKLVDFEGHYNRFRNYIQDDTWKEEIVPGGGLLYNLGSHLIDQALHLFGFPKSVLADIRIQRPGGKIDDNFELILDYGALKVTLKSGYLVREQGPRFILHGTQGSFIKYGIDPQEEDLKAGFYPTGPDWGREDRELWGKINTEFKDMHLEGLIETEPGSYMDFYNNVYEAIQQKKDLLVKPEEAMYGIQIIEAAIESNKQKKQVQLNFN